MMRKPSPCRKTLGSRKSAAMEPSGWRGGGHHRIVFGFDEVEAIVALGKALLLILKAILARFHAGIEKIEHIAVGQWRDPEKQPD